MTSQSRENMSFAGDVGTELIEELRHKLTETSIKCSERCLYQSSKWAAELLNSLPERDDSDDESQMLNSGTLTSSYRIFSTRNEDPEEEALELKEIPQYLLAKSFFDTKEYDRCASVFLAPALPAGGLAIFERTKGRTPTATSSKARGKTKQNAPLQVNPYPRLSQKSLFLALYARYLAGEKRKEEDSEMVLGPADGGQTTNRELPALARGLEIYFQERDKGDPDQKRSQGWLEYLYGIVLARSKQTSSAQQWLLRSVRQNPYHWGAWEELSLLLSSIDDLQDTIDSFPSSVMGMIYFCHASVDLFSTSDSTELSTQLSFLLSIFPSSTFLLTLQALSHYHAKDYETSASIFQSLLITHPTRLDALDQYSNILYVMADRPKLSFLAHLATSIDKFRPETCCVVGNYYSLCSQHEKAVMYFRRALTLDRSFLSAWTLMGHEYIELKNTHAAIESYRRVLDVNRKDYRAWYGLGQAYEVLDMGFYALFYYQRAAALRPYDAKMWQAVSSCYAKMEKVEQAIKAAKRALVAGTYYEESPASSFNPAMSTSSTKPRKVARKLLDPETLFQIAGLYEKLGSEDDAAKYMELCIAQETGSSAGVVEKAAKRLRRSREKEARRAEERRRASFQGQNSQETEVLDDSQMDMGGGDGDTEILSMGESEGELSDLDEDEVQPNSGAVGEDGGGEGFGTGTTATTSRARLWLARWAWRQGDLDRAQQWAEELCVDGFEVEEAQGLLKEVRGKREAAADGALG